MDLRFLITLSSDIAGFWTASATSSRGGGAVPTERLGDMVRVSTKDASSPGGDGDLDTCFGQKKPFNTTRKLFRR